MMKAVLGGLEKKQKDELNELLISSSEVKVSRLLGMGGFAVVNLATYRGQHTAMTQLLTINDESVKRFRCGRSERAECLFHVLHQTAPASQSGCGRWREATGRRARCIGA